MKFIIYSNMQKAGELKGAVLRLGSNFLCWLTGINMRFDHSRKKYIADGVYTPLFAIQTWPGQMSLDVHFWSLIAGFSIIFQRVWPFVVIQKHDKIELEVQE